MKTATIRARIDPTLKHDVESVLVKLGLSISDAIEIYMRQIKLTHGIPFNIRLPNKLTERTFEKTDQGHELNHYHHVKDIIQKLDD